MSAVPIAAAPRAARSWRPWIVAALWAPVAAFVVWALFFHNAKLFLLTTLNGITLAALYFVVASGFTLVFGLMKNVNLAHGSLYLLGAYVGYFVGDKSRLLAIVKDGKFHKAPEVAARTTSRMATA